MAIFSQLRVLGLFGLTIVGVYGCSGSWSYRDDGTLVYKEKQPVAHVVESSYAAADALISCAGNNLDRKKPLIAATFVNIDDLEYAASFGRAVSKQVSSRFTQRGLGVIEMLFRRNVFIKQNSGEFVLSRELRNISAQHDAQAVIVGTYAVGRKNVYVTARLIRAIDSIVLASYDYTLPKDPDVAFLLQHGCDSGCGSEKN